MEVCDKVTNGAASSKECLKNIVKRLNHSDPHVVIQAITVSFINLIVEIKIDDDFVGCFVAVGRLRQQLWQAVSPGDCLARV